RESMIKIRVPATTANLGPGFDCFGMALKLYLFLEIEEIEQGLIIQSQGEGSTQFEKDENNLIWKAFKSVLKRYNREKYIKGLRIKTLNQIPVTRGLGSSASAIIGGIFAASTLYDLKLSSREMLEIALSLEGHVDNIVPALLGGFTLAYSTEKEQVKWVKIKIPDDLKIVVAIPDFFLSTKKMRSVLPDKMSLSNTIFNLSRSALLVKALQNSEWTLLAEAMEDKIHQPFRISYIPGIEEMFSQIKNTGYAGIALSGSGPTVVSLTKRGHEKIISQIMEDVFQRAGINCRTLALEVDSEGKKLIE
ncbi:MAG: homoserine kinase, partial [Candidatus Caldatribacteriota bacterium]|nr:homoserine kinase [Candidatus Caldatribacteriota bacterium]